MESGARFGADFEVIAQVSSYVYLHTSIYTHVFTGSGLLSGPHGRRDAGATVRRSLCVQQLREMSPNSK